MQQHTNSNKVMEMETISKNRVSLKNQKNRGNKLIMKKPLFSLLIIVLLFSSCGSKENKNASADFTKSYEGTINGKYGIVMTLTKNVNNLTGTYRYKKGNGTSLKINGTIDNNGNLTINEFNEKGNMTGIFKGQLSGENIIGNWTKPDGSGTMPFSVSESSTLETSIVNSKAVGSWTGTYGLEYIYDVEGLGEVHTSKGLTIKGPDSDGAIEFELFVGVSSGCTGDISGTAYLTKNSIAHYKHKDEYSECHLTFRYKSGEIEVNEEGGFLCGHGASCSFDGVYKKEK